MRRLYFLMFRSWKLSVRVNRSVSYEEELRYIGSFRESKDPLFRAACQYRCHVFVEGFLLHFILNLLSFLFLPVYLVYLIFSLFYFSLVVKLKGHSDTQLEVDMRKGKVKGRLFNFLDLYTLFNSSYFYMLSPYLLIVALETLSKYRYLIFTRNPRKVYVSCEYSFSSSIAYSICNDNDVHLCNVMHGEKLFDIIDSFSTFNSVVIWDEYYKDLFIKLRVFSEEYIIDNPFVGLISRESVVLDSFCYYDQGLPFRYLENLSRLVEENNLDFFLRLHPLYCKLSADDEKLINLDMFDDIFQSLSGYQYICSRFSTVLYICVFNGKNVIIDDSSSRFEDLILRYPTFSVYRDRFCLLSRFLN